MNVYVPAGEGVISIAPLGIVHELKGVVLPVILMAGLIFVTITLAVAVQPFDVEVTVTV